MQYRFSGAELCYALDEYLENKGYYTAEFGDSGRPSDVVLRYVWEADGVRFWVDKKPKEAPLNKKVKK